MKAGDSDNNYCLGDLDGVHITVASWPVVMAVARRVPCSNIVPGRAGRPVMNEKARWQYLAT